jgi:LuxR family maltose regulon positive regulatory protein
VLVDMVKGMLHAGRGQHQSALEAFAAASARAVASHRRVRSRIRRLSDGSRPRRLALGGETRRALRSPDSSPNRRMGSIHNARAVICMAEGDPPRRWTHSESSGQTRPAGSVPSVRTR